MTAAQLDLIEYIDKTPVQNWRNTDPPTSKAAGISAQTFKADHHNAILTVLRASPVPLAAEQISDAIELAHASGRCGIQLDTVRVCKRLAELLESGDIVRTAETHKNRSGRLAFKVRINASHV